MPSRIVSQQDKRHEEWFESASIGQKAPFTTLCVCLVLSRQSVQPPSPPSPPSSSHLGLNGERESVLRSRLLLLQGGDERSLLVVSLYPNSLWHKVTYSVCVHQQRKANLRPIAAGCGCPAQRVTEATHHCHCSWVTVTYTGGKSCWLISTRGRSEFQREQHH